MHVTIKPKYKQARALHRQGNAGQHHITVDRHDISVRLVASAFVRAVWVNAQLWYETVGNRSGVRTAEVRHIVPDQFGHLNVSKEMSELRLS